MKFSVRLITGLRYGLLGLGISVEELKQLAQLPRRPVRAATLVTSWPVPTLPPFLLPFLLPLSVFLLEPTRQKQNQMRGFVILGGALMLYLLWGLIAYPLDISILQNSIVYDNAITTTTVVAVLYVIATCGSLFFSGFRELTVLAWANLIGLLVVMVVKRYAFTSIWCAYAAVVSVIIYVFFRRSREVRIMMYEVLPVI